MKTRFYYTANDYVDGEPDPFRVDGIQVILQRNPEDNWFMESHSPYYLLKSDDLWHGADTRGVLTEGLKRGDIRKGSGLKYEVLSNGEWEEVGDLAFERWCEMQPWILYGETLGNHEFHEVYQTAHAEMTRRRRTA